MDAEQARIERAKLEDSFRIALRGYEHYTGLVVTCISLRRFDVTMIGDEHKKTELGSVQILVGL